MRTIKQEKNIMEKYSLTDIATAVGSRSWGGYPVMVGNNGFGGGFGGDWGILLLFLLIAGCAGNGWGGGFGGGFGGGWANGVLTRAEMFDGFNNQNVMRKLDGITQGLCDGFYAQNTTMLQGFNTVGSQIAENRFAAQQCCCETNRNIDAVRFDNQKCCCDLQKTIHEEAETTRALINANKMESLRDRIAERDRELQTANFQLSQQAQSANLINTLRPFPQPAYITCSPYESSRCSSSYNYCGCGF